MSPVSRIKSTVDDPNGIVRRYAANSPFRSATAEELVNEENPFRRPVRPHDLGFLDYGKPLPADEVRRLSSLLGHRMLRTVYDADLLFLPGGGAGHPSSDDAAAFRSTENRILGRQAAGILEAHLFDWLDGAHTPFDGDGLPALTAWVQGVLEERRARPGRALEVAGGCRYRPEAASFALAQLTASRPAVLNAVGRNLLGDYDTAHPALRDLLLEDFRSRTAQAARYRRLLTDVHLSAEPYAYWQFLLASSLAGANHLHRVARAHALAEFLGAWVHHRIDETVTAHGYAALVHEAYSVEDAGFFTEGPRVTGESVAALTEDLLVPLLHRFGREAAVSFHRGFEDARRLAAVADEDLAVQLDWADRLDEYREKAEKLSALIDDNGIEVDLETFVESHEETSTTHVHDDHRLVVVEIGQMHFWNNVGQMIPMNEGDKLLIPAERLHGSMVRSGTCTYHQPVISEELLSQV